ncbi:MAG: hypothetical protein LBR58_08665 [Propionibacteriaceae bacterium]|nr:hypothetical protein [Propionibacteriaceae bacterium]
MTDSPDARAERAFHDYLTAQAESTRIEPLELEPPTKRGGWQRWAVGGLAAAASVVVAVTLIVPNLPLGADLRGVPEPLGDGTWTKTAPIPLSGRYGSATAWVDGKFYILGGVLPCGSQPSAMEAMCRSIFPQSGDWTSDGASYDPVADKWEQIADAPYSVSGTETAVVGETIWVLGAADVRSVVDPDEVDTAGQHLMAYNTATGEWSAKTDPISAERLVSVPGGMLALRAGEDAIRATGAGGCLEQSGCLATAYLETDTYSGVFQVSGQTYFSATALYAAYVADNLVYLVREGYGTWDSSSDASAGRNQQSQGEADAWLLDLDTRIASARSPVTEYGDRPPVSYDSAVYLAEQYGYYTSALSSSLNTWIYDPIQESLRAIVGPLPVADGYATAWGGMSYEDEWPYNRAPLVVGDYLESMGNFYHVPSNKWYAVPAAPNRGLEVLAASDNSVLSCFGDWQNAAWQGHGGVRNCYLLYVPALEEIPDALGVEPGEDEQDTASPADTAEPATGDREAPDSDPLAPRVAVSRGAAYDGAFGDVCDDSCAYIHVKTGGMSNSYTCALSFDGELQESWTAEGDWSEDLTAVLGIPGTEVEVVCDGVSGTYVW